MSSDTHYWIKSLFPNAQCNDTKDMSFNPLKYLQKRGNPTLKDKKIIN